MLQFVPLSLVLLASGLLTLTIAFVVWRRRRAGTGVVAFLIMLMAIAYWSLNSFVELLFTPLPIKHLLVIMLYAGIVTVPAAWLIFIARYTGRDKWLTPRIIGLLAIMPALTMLTIVTNPLHNAFWLDVSLQTVNGFAVFASQFGPGFWVHSVYSYLILAAGVVLLIQSMVRSPQIYRGQMSWLLLGAFAPWVANAVFILGLSPLPSYVDLTPLAFTITGAAFAWSLYRYRLMDIVPIAKDVIVDNIVDPIIVLDSDDQIVEANPKALEMLDLRASEVIGHAAAEVLADHTDLVQRFADVERARDEVSMLLQGEPHILELNIIPLRSRRGHLSGRVVMLHDITALKRANEELRLARERAEEASKLKSQFLATVSHELRTPLNAIIGFSELMLTGKAGVDLEGRSYHMTERIVANSTQLLSLINDLLDLSKIEAHRLQLAEEPFSPAAFLRGLYDETSSLAEQKDLHFTLTLADGLPNTVIGDQDHMRRVVVNLLSNAFKFTKAGEIELGARVDDDGNEWHITVRDTGVGIPPHALEYIFDPFRQVDGSSRRAFGGTGLGLAITKEIVTQMGGFIQVESTVGSGSTFTVHLPLKLVPQAVPSDGM